MCVSIIRPTLKLPFVCFCCQKRLFLLMRLSITKMSLCSELCRADMCKYLLCISVPPIRNQHLAAVPSCSLQTLTSDLHTRDCRASPLDITDVCLIFISNIKRLFIPLRQCVCVCVFSPPVSRLM